MLVYQFTKADGGDQIAFEIKETSDGLVVEIHTEGNRFTIPATEFAKFAKGVQRVFESLQESLGRGVHAKREFKALRGFRAFLCPGRVPGIKGRKRFYREGDVIPRNEIVLLPVESQQTQSLHRSGVIKPLDPKYFQHYLQP